MTLEAPPATSPIVADEIAVSEEVVVQIVEQVEIVPAEEQRVVSYFYKDSNLPEPCPVYAGHADSWWMDGGVKLHELMAHFKKRHTVKQACYLAGISETQYKYSLFRHLFKNIIQCGTP